MPLKRHWCAVLTVLVSATTPGLAADDKGAAEFIGRVVPAATVEIRARVTGEIIRVNCKAGAEMRQGDVLFEIDPRPYQAELERAIGAIGPAEARIKYYLAELERARVLRPTGGVSQGEFDRLEAERANWVGTLHSAKAAVDLARLNLEYTKVLAPMRGRISHPLAAGNVVRQNRYVLATLVADNPVTIAFGVDEKTMLWLMKAQPTAAQATVGFGDEDGFPHAAQIVEMGVEADPISHSVECRLVVPNAGRRVLPGMSARVRLAVIKP
jgi:RND family efflux transporter MFP subunit